LILRSDLMRISIPAQVHDGPPDVRRPSIILSADPCGFIRLGFAFLRFWGYRPASNWRDGPMEMAMSAASIRLKHSLADRMLNRSTIPEIARGRCGR